jgi:diguanylate cyclase (GGDEF)-like protein
MHVLWFLVAGALGIALGALAGIRQERRRVERTLRLQAGRQAELSRRLGEQERACVDAQADNRALSGFLVVLPDIVRHLNDNASRRAIPPLLSGCLERLFEPAQILVFLTQGEDVLMLVDGKGVPAGLERGRRIPFGKGPLGLVALHQRAMDHDEFLSESRFRRSEADMQDLPGVTLDLVAPMVSDGQTLGLLAVGRPASRHRDEKRMIRLVADLGALALVNQRKMSALESTANRDSLTGLCTKGFLNRRLGELVHAAAIHHTPVSVLIFDIDHFKQFNDNYGHLAGDEILKKFATLLKSQVRSDDIASRYGGEEFVVVLPQTAKDDAVRIAEKIRAAVEAQPFPLPNGRQGNVTVSGGVAALVNDGQSSQEILGAADQALYLAKKQGRNQVVAFQSRYLSEEEAEAAGHGPA